jgi:hypothetical protein
LFRVESVRTPDGQERNRFVGDHSVDRLVTDLEKFFQLTNGQGVGHALDSIRDAGWDNFLHFRRRYHGADHNHDTPVLCFTAHAYWNPFSFLPSSRVNACGIDYFFAAVLIAGWRKGIAAAANV